MATPVIARKTYLFTWLGLLGLTLLNTLLAYIDMGPLNTPVSLIIACIKVGLIVAIFMNAVYDYKMIPVLVVAGVVWLGILMILTLNDYITRGWLGIAGGK